MARSYLNRGLISLIGSSYNFETDFCDSSSSSTVAATSCETPQINGSSIPFLVEHSLPSYRLTYSTPPLCNNNGKYPNASLQYLSRIFRNKTSQTLDFKYERYKTVVQGSMFGNPRDFKFSNGLLGKVASKGKAAAGITVSLSAKRGGLDGLVVQRGGIKKFAGGSEASSSKPTAWKGPSPLDWSSGITNVTKNTIGPPTLPSLPKQVTVVTQTPVWNLEDYPEYYTFVLQHGMSVRHFDSKELWLKQRDEVTPHGLWAKGGNINQNEPFKDSLIPNITSMYRHWPNILADAQNDTEGHKRFWKTQWEKHGVKCPMTQSDYMRFVVRLKMLFGPIIDNCLKLHTEEVGKRSYLNTTSFLRDLTLTHGIFATIDSNLRTFTCEGIDGQIKFQELKEIKIYLDGKDPFKTIKPSDKNIQSRYTLELEMNVYNNDDLGLWL